MFQCFGRTVTVTLPASAGSKIMSVFPSEHYTGYQICKLCTISDAPVCITANFRIFNNKYLLILITDLIFLEEAGVMLTTHTTQW